MSQTVLAVWDCRVKSAKPLDIWKLIIEASAGAKPTTLLVLQPPDTDIPAPLQTVMRMTNSKIFVGPEAVDFCFLELALTVATTPQSQIILVTEELDTFVRAFRIGQPKQVVFITSQKLGWPLSEAKWAKPIQFVPLARRGRA
jgi:hypothetical protein